MWQWFREKKTLRLFICSICYCWLAWISSGGCPTPEPEASPLVDIHEISSLVSSFWLNVGLVLYPLGSECSLCAYHVAKWIKPEYYWSSVIHNSDVITVFLCTLALQRLHGYVICYICFNLAGWACRSLQAGQMLSVRLDFN